MTPDMPLEAPALTHNRGALPLRLLVAVLSGRALGALQAVLVWFMAGWAMWQPTELRALIAGGFAVFVLILTGLRAWGER